MHCTDSAQAGLLLFSMQLKTEKSSPDQNWRPVSSQLAGCSDSNRTKSVAESQVLILSTSLTYLGFT